MQHRLPQLKEENPILRPVNIYILSCTVNAFNSLLQLLICSMLLQPVPFPTFPSASYKHYCHLPSINPQCVRQEHWASSGKETSLSQDLIFRDTILKRHLNTDLCFVLLPITILCQTPPHEHSLWSFRICYTVSPLCFKTPLCCVHTDTKLYKCLINVTEHLPHSSASNFQSKKTSLAICQRRGTLKEHLLLFPFIAQGQTHLPAPPLQRWTVNPVCSTHSHTPPSCSQ